MTFTPADHLGAVTRALSTVTRDGNELRCLTVERTYDAPVDEVWDVLTKADRIPRWFMPVSGNLEVGGRFQLEGNAGGEVLDCRRPEALSITWEYGGQVSWVDVTLGAVPEGTLLRLDHTAPVDPAMWERYGPGAVGIGWELGLLGLAEHLAAPDSPRPGMPGAGEPDPVFMGEVTVGSSAGWAEASIAAGTDPAQARAGEAACTAFYTGEPAE